MKKKLVLNSSLPIEFINTKPDYFVGFQTYFFLDLQIQRKKSLY